MGGRNPVVVPVTADNFDLWRPRLAWHFESFCRGGDHTTGGLWDDLEKGDRFLWVIWDDAVLGCILLSITTGPIKKLVVTHGAGRDRHLWLPLWPVLEAFARGQGCKGLSIECRPGWEPDLRSAGMRKTHITMEKRL